MSENELPEMSPMGEAISNAIESKEDLNDSLGKALDAASEFGYQLGLLDKKAEVIALFETALKAMDETQIEQTQLLLNMLAKIEPNVLHDEDGNDDA